MYHDNFAQVDPQEQQDDSTKGKAVKIRQTYLTTRGLGRAWYVEGGGLLYEYSQKSYPLSPFETFHSLPL